MSGNKAIDLLRLIKGTEQAAGLDIVTVNTTDPDPVTFTFTGTDKVVPIGIFEVPVDCYPLKRGDRLLAFPLFGENIGQRWGIIANLNGGVVRGVMQSTNSVKLEGVDKVYGPSDIQVPNSEVMTLKSGDVVHVAPSYVNGAIKYVVLQRY